MAPKRKIDDASASRPAKAPLKSVVQRVILPPHRPLEKGDGICGACLLPVGNDEQVGYIDGCKHFFHHDCIERWSHTENSCPQCKNRFFWLASYSPQGQRDSLQRVQRKDQEGEEDEEYQDLQVCEKCKEVGDEATLLLCDGMHGTCNAAYHCACVGLTSVPRDSWFCEDCRERGFDIDAQGCRGKAISSSASATPPPAASSSNSAPGSPQSAEKTAAALRPALHAAALAATTTRSHRSNAGTTVPPQLRLSSLACMTPTAEVPSFLNRGTSSSAATHDSGEQQASDQEPAKEGLFATFAARRRAKKRAEAAGSTADKPTFNLNPAYEDDFMGKSVK